MKLLGGLLIFFCLACLATEGQGLRDQVYRSYLAGNIDSWETILKDSSNAGNKPEEWYDFALLHYGYIGYCLSQDRKERVKPYLERAEKITGELVAEYPSDPRYLALRGALYGLRINYQPHKAMFIGPKALSTVNLALKKGPDCPQAWVETGNKDWWMPEIFGGSKTAAIADYEKAISLMERDQVWIKGNWYYLNVNLILASCYHKMGRTFAAHEVFRKLILAEPDFEVARKELEK